MFAVRSQFFPEPNQLLLTPAGLSCTVVGLSMMSSSVLSSGRHAKDVFIICTMGCFDHWDWSKTRAINFDSPGRYVILCTQRAGSSFSFSDYFKEIL